MEKEIEKIKDTISEYERLLSIIGTDMNSICKLSKKEISNLFGKSYTATLKKLDFLERYGLLERITGGYKRTEKALIKDTPLSLLPRILLLVKDRPDIYYSFQDQADLLSVSINDIQTAWGFYSYFFGRKNPNNEN
jgi:hypothetical protein